MNPAQLIALFDCISDAPDAIPRLRRFILDLAVRGKLVWQRTGDEYASELLKRIRLEKENLVKAGILRKSDPLPTIGKSEFHCALPSGWSISNLQSLCISVTDGDHQPPPKAEKGIPFIVIGNIRDGVLNFASCRFVAHEYYKELDPFRRPKKGDILYTLVGSYGTPVLLKNDALFCVQRHIGILRPSNEISSEFLCHVLKSHWAFSQASECATGIAQKTVPLAGLRRMHIPLPPLAEQHRIAAKVDELMAICDQLEAQQDEREHRRARLTAATAFYLGNGATPEIFHEHAKFYLNHIPRLTLKPEQVPLLRQTILNLAVRGRLVAQRPNAESVGTQLLLNDQTREATAKKDHRADCNRQTLLAPELRWSVPSSWEWCALADLVLFIDYRGKTPAKVKDGVRLITAKNVRRGFVSLSPGEFVSERDYHAWMTRGFPKAGDVLFTTEAPMGNAAVVRLSEKFALAQRVICFRPYGAVNPDFLALQLLAEPFQVILDKAATGLTAKGIKAAKLKRLPMAVPPLAEQHRIVANVDELLALCDRLEAQINITQTESSRLLESVLHHALVTPEALAKNASSA